VADFTRSDRYWGVDVASTRLAFASVGRGAPRTWEHSWDVPDVAERLRQLRRYAAAAARDGAEHHPPAAVLIELPILRNQTNSTLLMAAGVATEAISANVACPVLNWDVQKWHRALAIGRTKGDALAWVAEQYPGLYPSLSEDAAEALAIARALKAVLVG
jgi:hypothetical protein